MVKKRKIIVMGGSFNPPTIAHYQLLLYAVEQLGADMGIFLPVSEAYLKRKMRKSLKDVDKSSKTKVESLAKQECKNFSKRASRILLNEEMRKSMLEAMCRDSAKLQVDDIEMRFPEMHTSETLEKLQEKYPDAELYFLMGDDKMQLVYGWAKNGNFFEKFKIVFMCRQLKNLEELFAEDVILERYQDRFVLVHGIEGIEKISSTKVRELFVEGNIEQAKDLLHSEVWKLFKDLQLENFPEEIEKFAGEYEFLHNNYPCSFTWNGQQWSCVESAYQSTKCKNVTDAMKFVRFSGEKAKVTIAKVELREDWQEQSEQFMEEILRAKFLQNPELAKKLVETQNAVLIFGTGKDVLWGKNLYTNQGENQLGKLLMRLRADLQADFQVEKQKVERE